jgi:hypothetical protein
MADSSVWVSHFRKRDRMLQALLEADQILCHPLIVIEIACGAPPAPREHTLGELQRLRPTAIATPDETLSLIHKYQFQNSGCGATDMALLASVLLTPDAVLWTFDNKLHALAQRTGVAFES